MKHLINWVEIPVTDMARAKAFYDQVLGGVQFQDMEMGGMQYALFPTEDRFNSGALVKGEYYTPSEDGVVIYLDGGKDLAQLLQRVSSACGQVMMEKTYLGPEAGHVGMFIDSEGNKIGLQHA